MQHFEKAAAMSYRNCTLDMCQKVTESASQSPKDLLAAQPELSYLLACVTKAPVSNGCPVIKIDYLCSDKRT